MVWQCPAVYTFWSIVSIKLSDIMQSPIPASPSVLLLDDTHFLKLRINERRILLAGLTAANFFCVDGRIHINYRVA